MDYRIEVKHSKKTNLVLIYSTDPKTLKDDLDNILSSIKKEIEGD